jgi:N-acetylmuramoyl-L-alanine amidase
MLPITQFFLTNKRNRPYLRDNKAYALKTLKGVVAHWTANLNKGATARANRHYFEITDRFASAHYIVDDHTILQCIPDNELGYHVGGNYYTPAAQAIQENLTPNYFLIGVEMCVNSDGDWNKTYQHAADLYAHLLRKYQLTTANLYRHFDITGKDCPKMMLDEAAWSQFKALIDQKMSDDAPVQIAQGAVNYTFLNVRSGPGTNYMQVDRLKKNDVVRIFGEEDKWWYLSAGRWVHKDYITISYKTRLGRVDDPTGANVRQGPGTNFPIIDARPNGSWLFLVDKRGSWYEIGPNQWVHESVADEILPRTGEVVNAEVLNVRAGPATAYRVIRQLKKGARVFVIGKEGDWAQLGAGEWASGKYIRLSV